MATAGRSLQAGTVIQSLLQVQSQVPLSLVLASHPLLDGFWWDVELLGLPLLERSSSSRERRLPWGGEERAKGHKILKGKKEIEA